MAQSRSRVVSGLAWIVLIGVVSITAIALLTQRFGWPIYLELLSHFQRQYWLMSLVGWGAIALTRRRLPALISLVCVAILTAQLLPWYLPPHFLSTETAGNFRILVSNVNTQNRDFDAVLQFAQQANPDLALFMEVDGQWIEQLNALSTELPYFSGEGNSNNFGIVMYSRYPLTAELVNFAADSTRSLTTTMTIQGQSLRVVGTHPLPPVKPPYFHSRNRQLDQLGQYLQGVEQPTIVIGDLNITMWSPYYQRLRRQTGLKNVRDGFGLLPSWPTGKLYGPLPEWLMPLFAIPIDHGLVSSELAVANVEVGPNIGSDHRPVVIDLSL